MLRRRITEIREEDMLRRKDQLSINMLDDVGRSNKMRTGKCSLNLAVKMVLVPFLWITSVECRGQNLDCSGFRTKWEIRNLVNNSFMKFDLEGKNRDRAIMGRRCGIKEGVKYLYYLCSCKTNTRNVKNTKRKLTTVSLPRVVWCMSSRCLCIYMSM